MARALAAGIAVLGSAIGIAGCGTGSTEPLDHAFGALDTPGVDDHHDHRTVARACVR